PPPPGNADARIETLTTNYRFEADGTGWAERSGRARIATPAGRDAFGQLPFPFDGEREEVTVSYVRIVKPDGTTVVTDLGSAFEQSMTPRTPGEAPTARLKVVPVTNLMPGDAL